MKSFDTPFRTTEDDSYLNYHDAMSAQKGCALISIQALSGIGIRARGTLSP
jgi:hypothetical protein